MTEADTELAFDIGKHCGTEAMKGMILSIEQRLRGIRRDDLRVATLILGMAYCGGTIARFRKVADSQEVAMLDEMIRLLSNDPNEIDVVRNHH